MIDSHRYPLATLLSVSLLVVCTQILLVYLVVKQPNLGFRFSSINDVGWLVESIRTSEPKAEQITEVALILRALDTKESPPYPLELPWSHQPKNDLWLSNPDSIKAFSYANEDLHTLQRQPKFGIEGSNGEVHWVDTQNQLSWNLLGPFHWASLFLGFLAFFGTFWLTISEKPNFANSVLAVAAVCLTLWITTATSIEARALAFAPKELSLLLWLQALGMSGFLSSYLMFLTLHPYPVLNSKSKLAMVLTMLALSIGFRPLIQANGLSQFAGVVYLFGAAALLAIQYFFARNNAQKRTSLKWIYFTWMAFLLLGVFYAVSHWLNLSLKLTPSLLPWLACTALLGMVISKLNLAAEHVELWFRLSWQWCLGGLLVIVLDLGLIYWINLDSNLATVISVIAVGLVWFPLRQWLQSRLVSSTPLLEKHMATIVSGLLTLKEGPSLNSEDKLWQWRVLLKNLFDPADLQQVNLTSPQPRISAHGLTLSSQVPQTSQLILLQGKHQGRELFNQDDIKLLSTVTDMAHEILLQKQIHRNSQSTERQRIMRDLHDDVCPLLLTLIHKNEDPSLSTVAREALRRLRESIYSLDDDSTKPIYSFVNELQTQTSERLGEKQIPLEWDTGLLPVDLQLFSRQHINVSRVVHEAISNCLKHSQVTGVQAKFEFSDECLKLTLVELGNCPDAPDTWEPGKGIHSMKKRVAELSGEIQWYLSLEGLTLKLEVPLGIRRTSK